MESYTIIVIIFGLFILGALVIISFMNRLILFKRKIEKCFSSVQTYLIERIQLLEKMSEFIQKNLEHEEVLLKEIEQKKKLLEQVGKCEDGVVSVKESNLLLEKLKKLKHVYPSLNSKKEYQELIKEISLNQDRMIYAFQGYDEGVKNYNSYRESPFILGMSKILRLPDYQYYNE